MSTFFMGISNCGEIPCAAQLRRSTVNWLMARRSAVGAASQNRRELIHGETGKGDPFWGLEAVVCWFGQITVVSKPYHGSLERIHGTFNSR